MFGGGGFEREPIFRHQSARYDGVGVARSERHRQSDVSTDGLSRPQSRSHPKPRDHHQPPSSAPRQRVAGAWHDDHGWDSSVGSSLTNRTGRGGGGVGARHSREPPSTPHAAVGRPRKLELWERSPVVSEDASTVEMLQEHIDQLGETIRMWDTYDRTQEAVDYLLTTADLYDVTLDNTHLAFEVFERLMNEVLTLRLRKGVNSTAHLRVSRDCPMMNTMAIVALQLAHKFNAGSIGARDLSSSDVARILAQTAGIQPSRIKHTEAHALELAAFGLLGFVIPPCPLESARTIGSAFAHNLQAHGVDIGRESLCAKLPPLLLASLSLAPLLEDNGPLLLRICGCCVVAAWLEDGGNLEDFVEVLAAMTKVDPGDLVSWVQHFMATALTPSNIAALG